MRIALYKDTLANNRGADRAIRNLAAGLAERGHEAVLFEKPELPSRLHEQWDVLISAGTNELLDLMGTNTALPPVVQQFHTDPAYQFRHWLKKWRRNRAIKAALRNVSAIQVLHPEHANWLRQNVAAVRTSAIRLSAIGNWSGIDATTARHGSEKIVICPGAINDDKNQQLLIRAFAKIRIDFPDWQVEFYGSGSMSNERHLLQIAGRNEAIRFKGFCDLREAYARCAFVAFPSKTEGFPLAIVEAASFARPAVMIHDWIGTAAIEGGLVVKDTVNAYANALRRLMSDMSLCRQMGENARRFCAERYSRAHILDEWEALLSQVKCPPSATSPAR